MNHMDALMSDVMVVLDKRWEDKLDDAVEQLKKAGMNVESADDDKSVVEGSIESYKIKQLEQLDCVDYVRTVFSWVADYPAGDPRDLDGPGISGA